MEKNSESDFKIKVGINSVFEFQIKEVILCDSDSLFTDTSITSPSEQSRSAEEPFAMIKRKKNEGKIITEYNREPAAKRHKLERETLDAELKKKMQSAIRSKRYRDRLKKERLEVDPLLIDKDDSQSDVQGDIPVEGHNPELKKKMQSAIRSKRYRDRLKLKKESLEVDPLLIDKDDSQSDVQGDIPVEAQNPELKKKIQNANKNAALLSNKDDSQNDIHMEVLNPELKKRLQAAIRAKRYRDRLKLRKKSLEVGSLLINKDDSQSDVQRDISMEALNLVLKKRMQGAIRSKRYRDRLKLRKKSLEVDPLLINKYDSQSDVLENTSTETLNKELKKKMQGAIRSKRYRERLKLAKERVNVDDFLSIKHASECDDVSGDSLKNGNCLFSSLIRKLQLQVTSDLPKQLLQPPNVHSCTDANNAMRILRGELDSKALDCVTVFSKLLDMNKGVWPITYS